MNQHVQTANLHFEEPVPPPSARHRMPFADVGAFHCKFITGDPDENAVCCGARTDGKSWCTYHRRIVFEARQVRVR